MRKIFAGILISLPVLLLVGVIWVSTRGLTYDHTPERDRTSYFLRTDSLVSASDAGKRVDVLRDVILQHIASNGAYIISRSDSRMLALNILAAILAGLSSAIILSHSQMVRRWISWLTVFVIVAMYGLDVHTLDLKFRFDKKTQKLENTLDSLLSLDHTHTYWINLSSTSIEHNSSDYARRWKRKIELSLRPNLEQVTYYFIPLFILSLVLAWSQTVPAYKGLRKQSPGLGDRKRIGRSA